MTIEPTKNSGSWLLRLIFFFGLILAVLISIAVYKEIDKKNQIQSEINKLQEQAKNIEKENLELRDKISYLDSADYKEKEAKDKLNLQSPEESLVIIKPSPTEQKVEVQQESPPAIYHQIAGEPASNLKKWWEYFFK